MINTKSKGNGINGGIAESQDGRSWVTFYVETADLGKTLAKAEQLGGRTVMQPMDAGMITFALFSDPEGNVIGLAKNTEPAAHAPEARARATSAASTRKRPTTRKRTSATTKTRARSRRKRS